MDTKHSSSGRLKRPTDTFFTYVQESSLRKKCKPVTNDSQNVFSSSLKNSSRKKNNLKEYSCSQCGFTAMKKSSQDFIKFHHLQKENKMCFTNGLVHCPNTECDKVFLSDIDMERHCTMSNQSKTNCLKAYRDSKTMLLVNMRHHSTQVDVCNVSPNSGGRLSSVQFNTLYQCVPLNFGNSNLPINNNIQETETLHANFTSGSHCHNVVIVQGEYLPTTSNFETTELEERMGKDPCNLTDIISNKDSGENTLEFHDNVSSELFFHQHCNENENNNTVPPHTVDEYKLIMLKEKINKASRNSCFTREDHACLSLEEILRNAGTPLYLYDKILTWAIRNRNRLPARVPMINRKKLCSGMSVKLYGDASNEMMPKEIFTTLPSGRCCGVTVFNIYSQITSLLENPDINNWSNYIFDPTPLNPFNLNIFSDWDLSWFNDIETSIWYERTLRMSVKDKDNEILVPICLFIDGTVLSLSGSLSLEPVMFSLMIHNRETRKNPKSWLPLGYIHDPTSLAGKPFVKPEEKYSDYHSMLSIVLKDLIDLVEKNCNGLLWHFKNVPGHKNGMTKTLIFKLAFIIGDTKGHDILCGRMGSHNLTPGLCRDCDMLTQFADDPNIPCKFLKQSDLMRKNKYELQNMSFYQIPFFAFDRLKFGASPYGINCGTAIDIIHGILIGMTAYLYDTFTDQLTAKQQKKLSSTISFIATFCSKAIPGFQHCHHFRKGLFLKGIMTAKMKLARCLMVYLALNSKTFETFLLDQTGKLPSAVQKKKRKRKEGKENMSISDAQDDSSTSVSIESSSDIDDDSSSTEEDAATYMPPFTSEYHQYFSSSDDDSSNDYDISPSDNDKCSYDSDDDSTYDPHEDIESKDPIIFTYDVYQQWKEVFENMLLLYGWLTSENMSCQTFKFGSRSIAKYCTEKFMCHYKEVAYRFEGMGLKLTKFHQLRHWYFYISMYGVPSNFDSSFCESHHIHHTKKTGRRTQRRQDELASQTARRVYEGNLLSKALQLCQTRHPKHRRRKNSTKTHNYPLGGAKFSLIFDYSTIDDKMCNPETSNRQIPLQKMFEHMPIVSFSWVRSKDRCKRHFSKLVLQSVTQKLAWLNNGDCTRRMASINGYTELHLLPKHIDTERSIVRAHPDYRGKGFWFDWVSIQWENEEKYDRALSIPAQVLMILDFDSIVYEPLPHEIVECYPILRTKGMDILNHSRTGIHILVHSASENTEESCTSIAHRYVMEPFFQMIEMQNIEGNVFVCRDPPSSDCNELDFEITHVVQPSLWGGYFIPRFSHGYEIPADSDLCSDEFNEIQNPW